VGQTRVVITGSTRGLGLRMARALAVEAKGTGVLVGALSPGIMVRDFTMKQIDRGNAEAWKRTKKVFNVLADTPETVAAFLVPRILAAKKSGTLIAWLTNAKIMFRFMTGGMIGPLNGCLRASSMRQDTPASGRGPARKARP